MPLRTAQQLVRMGYNGPEYWWYVTEAPKESKCYGFLVLSSTAEYKYKLGVIAPSIWSAAKFIREKYGVHFYAEPCGWRDAVMYRAVMVDVSGGNGVKVWSEKTIMADTVEETYKRAINYILFLKDDEK